MSGIGALYNTDGAPVDPELLRKMTEQVAYRGPDGIHYWIQGNVGMAHLALHATPEALREHLPLLSADGQLTLTADARIDNRDELIPLLRAKDCLRVDEPTDADLILAAYQCWGEDCPTQLIGDYAFVIWDTRQQRLFAARDAMGVKPLHYYKGQGFVCVTSEAQQILQHPAVPRKMDEIAMGDYLVGITWDVERTMFQDIRFVKPGHSLSAMRNGLWQTEYWKLDSGQRIRYHHDDEYVEHYLDLFRRAVRDRLHTQSEMVGISMSGGLDSTSIAAVAQQMISQEASMPRLYACSYAFDTLKECDERQYTKLMTGELGVEVEYVPAEQFWPLSHPEIDRPDLESPAMGMKSLDSHILDRFKALGARVEMTGATWLYSRLGDYATVFAYRLAQGDLGVLKELWQYSRGSGLSFLWLLYARGLRPLLPDGLIHWVRQRMGRQNAPLLPAWILPAFAQRTGLVQRLASPPGRLNIARQLKHLCCSWSGSVQRMLYLCDRLAAGHGVEMRHPFIDRRLLEYLISIPPRQGYLPGQDRWILRRAMADLLPEAIRTRPDKTSFNNFYRFSMCKGQIGRMQALCKASFLGKIGVVDSQHLCAAYNQCCTNDTGDLVSSIWFVVTAELWLETYQQVLL